MVLCFVMLAADPAPEKKTDEKKDQSPKLSFNAMFLAIDAPMLADMAKKKIKLPVRRGLVVSAIADGGAAAAAGMKTTDIVVMIDGQSVTSAETYQAAMAGLTAGKSTALELWAMSPRTVRGKTHAVYQKKHIRVTPAADQAEAKQG